MMHGEIISEYYDNFWPRLFRSIAGSSSLYLVAKTRKPAGGGSHQTEKGGLLGSDSLGRSLGTMRPASVVLGAIT